MKILSYIKNNIYVIAFALVILFLISFSIFNVLTNRQGTWSNKFFYIPTSTAAAKLLSQKGTNRKNATQNIESKQLQPSLTPPNKKDSYGEIECRRVLEDIFKRPFPKCRPNFLKNQVTGGKYNLELDCFNEDLRLAVEYDGIAHHKYVPYFHRNYEAFETQKYRDFMKDTLCKDNNIILIRVPYTVKQSEIEKFLIKKLKEI
jgi:hypothetical protein